MFSKNATSPKNQANVAVRSSTGNGPETSRVVKTTPGLLLGYRVVASAVLTTDVWIQLFDAAALPANGTTPIWRAAFPIGTIEVFDDPPQGLNFDTGIVIASSTTFLTLTVGGPVESLAFHVSFM